MDDTYAEVGAEVILGRHKRRINGDLNWCSCMDEFVGRQTIITNVDRWNSVLVCRVKCVGSRCCHLWRVEDMILASDVPLLTAAQKRELGIEYG